MLTLIALLAAAAAPVATGPRADGHPDLSGVYDIATLTPLTRPGGLGDRLSLSDAEAKALRHTARRTWRYFETFVTVADNMLPPDNFQEAPTPAIAHRTSPTNIGLYLLSIVSARDFGWIGETP